ncbi:MAG: UMP kinase [Clostridia bacterium]|jgi:uridylate kinase|nr:UMP kinase [Clostridia bacterium]
MRVLIKLSAEALAGEKKKGFNEENALEVGNEIKKLVDEGHEVAIVVGAGNLWRGRSSSNKMDQFKAHQIGILATVMNAMYMSEILHEIDVDNEVNTPFVVGDITKVFLKDEVVENLKKGKVVIFGGGLGRPYFSSDTAAALRSIEIDCDLVLFAKNVDAVYDKDPNVYPDAKKYDKLTYSEMIEKQLKVIDLTASILCEENDVEIRLFNLNKKDAIIDAVNGKNNGTIIKKQF